MKKLFLFLIIFIGVSMQTKAQYTISTATRLQCMHGSTFNTNTPAPAIGTLAEPGPDYSCIPFATRPVWFYTTFCGGFWNHMDFTIGAYFISWPNNDSLSVIVWGPFTDTTNLVSQLNAANIVFCQAKKANYPLQGMTVTLSNIPKNSFYIGVVCTQDTISSVGFNGSGPNFTFNDAHCGMCDGKVTSLYKDLCLVAYDSASQKNMPVWEKDSTETNLESYNIYREGSVLNQFDSIGNVPITDPGFFIDYQVNPAIKSYRYKIAGRDTCGNVFLQDNSHTTVHLQINTGVLGEVNLAWNNYVGYTPSTYYIWRGSSQANLTPLDSVASNITSYTDFNPSPGLNFYRISFNKTGGCYADTNLLISAARSNITYANVTAIAEPSIARLIKLYPNPAKNSVTLDYSSITQNIISIDIKNTLGQIIQTIKPSPAKHQTIATDAFNRGIYIIELKSDEGLIRKKLMLD